MSQNLLYLKMTPYLAEWYANENRAEEGAIKPPRGSSESDILERFLQTGRKGRDGEIAPEDANLVIEIPYFRGKDPKYYNYLPPKARRALEQNIYVRFRCELWKDIHTLENVDCPIGELIWSWMEQHGISDTPQNWEAIRQLYYRKRNSHRRKAASEAGSDDAPCKRGKRDIEWS